MQNMSEKIDHMLVKELREITGAGVMDCKKVLAEAKGNIKDAIDILRKSGIAGASKKADRVTKEGAIAICISDDGTEASVIELNSETDFVSRNEKFQHLIKKLAKAACIFDGNISEKIDLFKDNVIVDDLPVHNLISEHIAIIGENINLRRAQKIKINKNGIIAHYVHNTLGDNIGKVGVIVAIESDGNKERLSDFGKQIAMHIAAFKPETLYPEQLSRERIEKECEIFREQAKNSGKPDHVIEKMVQGRIQKLYEEIVLLEQQFVMDNKQKVKDIIANLSKELNTSVKLVSFIRFGLGEKIL